jgi:hypothetical protein
MVEHAVNSHGSGHATRLLLGIAIPRIQCMGIKNATYLGAFIFHLIIEVKHTLVKGALAQMAIGFLIGTI